MTLIILRGRGLFIILPNPIVSPWRMLDKLLYRGLRQLRLRPRSLPKQVVIDRAEIRKKVQSLHEIEEEPVEWGVESKFQMEAFTQFDVKVKKDQVIRVSDNNLDTVIEFIKGSSAADNLKIYNGKDASQILLSLSSVPARQALLQLILTSFKPLFPKRFISVDGNSDKKAEWIVIDLKGVIVHIFDPQIRSMIDLDGKLESEIGMKLEDNPSEFLNKFSNSLPRSIASKPNFIEKFRLRKSKQQ